MADFYIESTSDLFDFVVPDYNTACKCCIPAMVHTVRMMICDIYIVIRFALLLAVAIFHVIRCV